MINLSTREQEVYQLHFCQQRPYKTVAEWLGIEPSTIRTYQDRIRKKFKAAGLSLGDNRRHFIANR